MEFVEVADAAAVVVALGLPGKVEAGEPVFIAVREIGGDGA